jgi:hypothetical protein
MCEPFVVLFPLIPLTNPWVKGLDFGVFRVLGLEELLAGFLRFLLICQVWVDINLAMDPHEVFLLSPKSCANLWSDSEIGSWIWGSWPAGVVHPDELRSHRSDWCLSPVWPVQTPIGFFPGERLVEFAIVPCFYCFEFGSFWSSMGLFGVLGLSGLDRSDRCATPAWLV